VKRWLPTLIALVILAAVGVYVGLYETKPQPAPKEKIYEQNQDDIVKFELKDIEKGITLVCEKEPDGIWWITAPTRLEAEADTVDLVTRHLANPEVERKLELQEDLAPFKLQEPAYRATLFTKDGASRTLLIGAKNPMDSAYFVREKDGSHLYTVYTYSVDNFRKTVADLRNKTLMSFDPALVNRLTLKRSKGGTVEFVRQGEEAWKLTKPVEAPADRFTVDSLLNDIKALKGTEVIEEPYAYSRYKLDQPSAEVIVYTGTGTAQQLTLARPDPEKEEAYASSSRLPFVLKLSSAFILTNVSKELTEFRERLLLSVNREDLTEARITYGGLTIVISKDQDTWSVKEPAGAKAEDEMNDMLFEIIYVRAEEFTDDAPKNLDRYGLDPPKAEVIIRGVKDEQPFTYHYRLGKRAGDHAYLQVVGRSHVVEVRKELLEKVERFAEKIRSGSKAASPPSPS